MGERIMLLEDDKSLVDGLVYALEKSGFCLDVVRNVEEAMESLGGHTYDLLLLDVTLPDGTGFDVCEQVRGDGNDVPIIFLTASDEEVNVIRGLDCGGDDYITKPFKLGELCSRIRALLRRTSGTLAERNEVSKEPVQAGGKGVPVRTENGSIQMKTAGGNVVIDLTAGRVRVGSRTLELTSAEYKLFVLLVRNEGMVVTRDIIFHELWDGAGNYVDDNTLSVYIRRLRKKVEEDPSNPRHLLTVRGFGYEWKGEV